MKIKISLVMCEADIKVFHYNSRLMQSSSLMNGKLILMKQFPNFAPSSNNVEFSLAVINFTEIL